MYMKFIKINIQLVDYWRCKRKLEENIFRQWRKYMNAVITGMEDIFFIVFYMEMLLIGNLKNKWHNLSQVEYKRKYMKAWMNEIQACVSIHQKEDIVSK